jgi:hypothetical protein
MVFRHLSPINFHTLLQSIQEIRDRGDGLKYFPQVDKHVLYMRFPKWQTIRKWAMAISYCGLTPKDFCRTGRYCGLGISVVLG